MQHPKTVVIHVVQHLSPGGIECICLEMLLKSPEHKVHIVSLEGSFEEMAGNWSRLVKLKPRLHFMRKITGLDYGLPRRLSRLFTELKANVVQTHHIGPLLYGGLACKLAGVRSHIHTEHDGWHLSKANHKRIISACLKLFKPKLVADAAIVAKKIKEAVPYAKPVIIPNGIDTRKFKPESQNRARRLLNLPPNVPMVGCAARLNYVKGIDLLLDALFRLPTRVHLVIAGVGPEEKRLRKQVQDLNLQDRVHFLGLVQDMPKFYQAIDVFCLASREEGMPLSPLEAQACGKPAVVTDVGGSREALCPDSGQLVSPHDSYGIAQAVLKLLELTSPQNPRDFVVQNRDLRGTLNAYAQLHQA